MLMWLELLKGANNVLIALPLKTQWVAFTLLVSSSNTQPNSQFSSTCNNTQVFIPLFHFVNNSNHFCKHNLGVLSYTPTWVIWVIYQLGCYEFIYQLGCYEFIYQLWATKHERDNNSFACSKKRLFLLLAKS
jgi:hypothetical protein